MKAGFPNIWKINKNRLKDSEPIDTVLRLSNESPLKFEEFYEKEISRLDHELDSYEISALNQNSWEFSPYRYYLERISMAIKSKLPTLAMKVLRGVHGWEKSMRRAQKSLEVSKEAAQSSIKTAEFGMQTETEEPEELSDNEQKILRFIGLKRSLKQIKISKLTQKLKDIYNKLRVIETDLPSGSKTPDLPEYGSSDIKFENGLNETVHSQISASGNRRELRGKFMIPKEVQTDGIKREGYKGVSEGEIEKELSLIRKKREIEGIIAENKEYKEVVERMNVKIDKLELEIRRLKGNSAKRQVKVNEGNEKDDEGDSGEDEVKKKYESLHARYIKQQKRVNELTSMVFNSKVLWKTAEFKLDEISKAWVVQTGSKFLFKPVDYKKIVEDIRNNEDQDKDLIEKVSNEILSVYQSNFREIDPGQPSKLPEIPTDPKPKIIMQSEKRTSSVIPQKDPEVPKEFKPKALFSQSSSDSLPNDHPNHILFNEPTKLNEVVSIPESKIFKKNMKSSDTGVEISLESKTKQLKNYINSTKHSNLPTSKIKFKSVGDKGEILASLQLGTKPEPTTTYRRLANTPTFNTSRGRPTLSIPSNALPSEKTVKLSEKPYQRYSMLSPNDLNLNNFETYLESMLPFDYASAFKELISQIMLTSHNPSKISTRLTKRIKNINEINDESNESHSSFESINDMLKVMVDVNEKNKKALVMKVFNHEEIRSIPKKEKVKINMLLVGHDIRCGDVCEHLKKVMAFKSRVFGVRYPWKTQLIKFD